MAEENMDFQENNDFQENVEDVNAAQTSEQVQSDNADVQSDIDNMEQNSNSENAEDVSGDAKNAELEAKIAELEAKVEKQHNDYLLLYADFDNYKKRTFKEKTDAIFSAKKGLLDDMLAVVDDFERSLTVMENAEDVKAIKEGVDNIYRKFINYLSQKGVKAMDIADVDFNTDFHEAVAIVPAPGKNNKVIDCTQKGYMMGDKVMRFAKVVVGKDE